MTKKYMIDHLKTQIRDEGFMFYNVTELATDVRGIVEIRVLYYDNNCREQYKSFLAGGEEVIHSTL